MLFIKKLLILSALGGGITIPVVKSVTYSEPDPTMLEYDSITNRWNQLLKKIPEQDLKEKVSLFFSKNLTTFATLAMENTVKQLLVNWVIEIWENSDLYFPLSYKLKKFFSDYQVNYWKVKNDLDELSWDLVKNFFTDFFFKEKGWIFLSQYGDFRSFVLQEWERKEKPMTIYEWTINYSSKNPNDSKSIYSDGVKSNISGNSYLWPEFEYNSRYHDFIAQFKHLNKVDLSSFTKKIWTISDLKKIEDGRKLGTLLHMMSLMNRDIIAQTQEVSSVDFKEATPESLKDSRVENPLYLFLERRKEKEVEGQEEDISDLAKPEECTLIQNSIFNTEFSKRISNYDHDKPDYHFYSSKNLHSCLYGLRELKNGWSVKPQLFASREKNGVSLYYLPNYSNNYHIDELTQEVSDKISKYLKDNFESIFFRYLHQKHSSKSSSKGTFELKLTTSKNVGKWDFSSHFDKYSELLNASSDYLDELYWVNNVYEFQKILAQAYSDAPKSIKLKKLKNNNGSGDTTQVSSATSTTTASEEEYKVQLQTSDGLFSPLPFKRAVDSASDEQEIKFSDLRNTTGSTQNNNQRKNDGFYSHLMSSFLAEDKFYSLEEKASNLQSKLKDKLTFSTINDLFSKDLFIRAQLEKMIEDKEMSINSLFRIWAEKTLFNGANKNDTDFEQIISSFTSSALKPSGSTATTGTTSWKDLIEKTLFLESYLNLPLQEQSIFGAHKHKSDDTLKTSSSSASANNSNGDEKDRTLKAKNSWILKNYYLSDSAYESSSEEFKKFLSYLYSVYWLTANNYSNLPQLMNHLFKKDQNKNAYLVWFKEVNSEEIKKLNGRASGSGTGNNNSHEELSKTFKTNFSSDIFNPLLMGQTTVKLSSNGQSKDTPRDVPFNSENVLFETKGYSKNGNGGKTEDVKLAGFAGLFTSTFSSRDIPEEVKTTIFEKFWKTNSHTNTNYSSQNNGSNSNSNGVLEGLFFEDNYKSQLHNNEELKDFLINLKTKNKFLKYLNSSDPTRPFSKLLQTLSSGSEDERLENLTIEKLKEKISSTLEKTNTSQQDDLYKMWNRFSGYLYLGEGEKYPYVLNIEEGGKTKNYVVFMYQVNQFDFEQGKIESFKNQISEETLHMMISLLASNKEVSNWIYRTGLTSQLSLF